MTENNKVLVLDVVIQNYEKRNGFIGFGKFLTEKGIIKIIPDTAPTGGYVSYISSEEKNLPLAG